MEEGRWYERWITAFAGKRGWEGLPAWENGGGRNGVHGGRAYWGKGVEEMG